MTAYGRMTAYTGCAVDALDKLIHINDIDNGLAALPPRPAPTRCAAHCQACGVGRVCNRYCPRLRAGGSV
jgi:hypothetical protein